MKYELLLKKVHEIHDLRKAARLLAWDREVAMPQGGADARTQQITTLNRISHSMFTSDAMGELIAAAASELNGQGYDSKEASLVRFLSRDYAMSRKLSAEFVSRSSTLSDQAISVWKQARREDDFGLFMPWLSRIVASEREKAELLGYEDEPYDALLDTYEPGQKTIEIDSIFEATKQELIPLYQSVISRRDAVDDTMLRQTFAISEQEQLAHSLAENVGYDFSRGCLSTAVHPFSTSISRNDVRITTRYDLNYLGTSLFSTLHEAGHAIYVQNVRPELARTPLAKETSAGLDESQSRMFENFIGRSRGFWRANLPKLQERFPEQLGHFSAEQFYRAVNKVQPGFVRVEADELTYNLHIIIRFELEKELINGTILVSDLPEAWSSRMERYLGITPPNDRLGCLQDIHWAMVGFGYFPSYALGNLYAAQLFEAAASQQRGIARELEEGRIRLLLEWLREHVHQHGRKFTPAEIVERATGRPLDHHAFMRYATDKFTEIYGLS